MTVGTSGRDVGKELAGQHDQALLPRRAGADRPDGGRGAGHQPSVADLELVGASTSHSVVQRRSGRVEAGDVLVRAGREDRGVDRVVAARDARTELMTTRGWTGRSTVAWASPSAVK